MKKKFSVLMANYNNGRYIQEAIDSVLHQTYTDWELIIVDDSSTDESLEIIKPYLEDSRIKLFCNANNSGCGFTKKRCVDEATGAYSGYLDPDDTLVPEAIESMIEAHKVYPDAGLIHSKSFFCDDQLVPFDVGLYAADVSNIESYLLHEKGGVTHFVSFSTLKYRSTEGLSTEFSKAVDQDLYYLMDETGPFYFINKPLYYYRIHKGGISTNGNVIGATYQHFKVKLKAARRQIKNPRFSKDKKLLSRLIARCTFHLSILDRQYLTAPIRMLTYLFRGGSREIVGMFSRLVSHPKRVVNTLTKTYKVK